MDNACLFKRLSLDQARQLVDCRQIFDALLAAEAELAHRFAGRMAWKRVKERDYLYRRRDSSVERSLGPRSPETEAVAVAFHEGKGRLEQQVQGLRGRLERMAPVNVALGLGRVPDTVARIARRLHASGLLGPRVIIAGTNALFAYEVAAGIQVQSALPATGDVDITRDARRRLGLIATLPSASLIALLRQVDRSFRVHRDGDFRAISRDGFMVDLITPTPRDALRSRSVRRIGVASEDLAAAEIENLQWLVEAPRFETIAVAENGLPLRLVVPDPRFFAAHKFWLAERSNRDPLKRRRDRLQAEAVAALLSGPLSSLPVSDMAPAQIPAALRDRLRAACRATAAVAASYGPRPAW